MTPAKIAATAQEASPGLAPLRSGYPEANMRAQGRSRPNFNGKTLVHFRQLVLIPSRDSEEFAVATAQAVPDEFAARLNGQQKLRPQGAVALMAGWNLAQIGDLAVNAVQFRNVTDRRDVIHRVCHNPAIGAGVANFTDFLVFPVNKHQAQLTPPAGAGRVRVSHKGTSNVPEVVRAVTRGANAVLPVKSYQIWVKMQRFPQHAGVSA